MKKNFLNTSEAAAVLGVSPATFRTKAELYAEKWYNKSMNKQLTFSLIGDEPAQAKTSKKATLSGDLFRQTEISAVFSAAEIFWRCIAFVKKR